MGNSARRLLLDPADVKRGGREVSLVPAQLSQL